MPSTSHKILVLVSIMIIVACGESAVDVTPPTMDVVSYTPEPVEDEICGSLEPTVFRVVNNQDLVFDVVFNDDEGLSQYKVDIHNNFDCHGHGGGSAPSIPVTDVENQTTDWSVLDIQDISGESAPIVRTLTVPDNVTAGNYHFHIQVIDESGNDSPFANFNAIKVQNLDDTEAPQITVQEPAAQSFSMSKGETIRFVGQVTDNRGLNLGGNGILYLAYTDLSSGNTFATDQAFSFESVTGQVYDFDFEYVIPQTLVSRTYRYSLGANDGVRNVAPFVFFEVEVL